MNVIAAVAPTLADDATAAAGDLGDLIVPKRCTIWSSAPGTGASDARCSMSCPAADRLAAEHGLAIPRPRGGSKVALAVGEGSCSCTGKECVR